MPDVGRTVWSETFEGLDDVPRRRRRGASDRSADGTSATRRSS